MPEQTGITDMEALSRADRLNGVPPKQKRKIVLVDWAKKEHPADEE